MKLFSCTALRFFAVLSICIFSLQTNQLVAQQLERETDSVKVSTVKKIYFPKYEDDRVECGYYDTYCWWENDRFTIVDEETVAQYTLKTDSEICDFMARLKYAGTIAEDDMLEEFGISLNQLKLQSNDILQLYDGYYRDMLKWNRQQLEYLLDSLNNKELRLDYLKKYLSNTHRTRPMGNNFRIEIYRGGNTVSNLMSGKEFYAYFMGDQASGYCKGKPLLSIFLDDYIENNYQQLLTLGWWDHKKYVDKLEEEFEVVAKGQFWDDSEKGGRYTRNNKRQYIFSLKGKGLPSNVRINFIAQEQQGKLFSSKPMMAQYMDAAERALSYSAIRMMLENEGAELSVFFFNDLTINDYLVNGSKYCPKLKNISQNLFKKAITVELVSGNHNKTLMLLLPNDNIVLYNVRGTLPKELDIAGRRINTGPFNICGELFTQDGDIITSAGVKSIEIHWKATGNRFIENCQQGMYRGSWIDLVEEYGSKEPYMVGDSEKIEKIYRQVTKYKDFFGSQAQKERQMTSVIMDEMDVSYHNLLQYTKSILKWNAHLEKNDSIYLSRFKMNPQQKEYFISTFTRPQNFSRYMEYLLEDTSHYGVNQYKVVIHRRYGDKDTLLSGKDFFAHSINPYLKDVWKEVADYDTPRGEELYNKMLKLYMLEHGKKLHELGRYDIVAQLDELEKTFLVGASGQLMDFGKGGGVYVDNASPAYYAMLHKEWMPENLQVKYIFEKKQGEFKPFDNLRKDFDKTVKRVMRNEQLMQLLRQDLSWLDITYVNDSPLSNYLSTMIKGRMNEDNFKLPESALYVEHIQWKTNEEYKHPYYFVQGYLLLPNGKLIQCKHGRRIFFGAEYKVDDPETWVTNRPQNQL